MTSTRKLEKQSALLTEWGFKIVSTLTPFEMHTAPPGISCFTNNALIDTTSHERTGAGAVTKDGKMWSRETSFTTAEVVKLKQAGFHDMTKSTNEFAENLFKRKRVN